MKTIIQPGARAWEMTCAKCCARFRYELSDMLDRTFLWSKIGYQVVCPQCREVNDVPKSERSSILTPGRERSHKIDDNPPSYEDLVEELAWFVSTVENIGSLGDDEEEDEDVHQRVRAAKVLLARASSVPRLTS